MKTQQQLETALKVKQKELQTAKDRLHDVQCWIDGANFLQCEDMFISSIAERNELNKRIERLATQVEIIEWLLA
ncbi:MAG: hypothetical protein MJ156_00295 [Alphaproteobacteria bacterium]|nr:hypothetical protein [Alphaproteobacteria bacterium]